MTALRILVVDDHQDSADTLALLLGSMGHEAITAYDGARALALAAGFKPHVVLLDIAMPGLDGYEVALRLRSDMPDAGVHIIAVTGYGQKKDIIRTYEAGFNAHLLKPVGPMQLDAVLARYAEFHQKAGAGRKAAVLPSSNDLSTS
jgi:CheY-like chemotaxis protein